jgi:hypothetical protein
MRGLGVGRWHFAPTCRAPVHLSNATESLHGINNSTSSNKVSYPDPLLENLQDTTRPSQALIYTFLEGLDLTSRQLCMHPLTLPGHHKSAVP